ncbi:MAG: FkbM family methyltransferase [Chromatiales bacterium]|nr:MAG: FkbM family methyltransferase [Chromatiales bacterium]
MLKLDGRHELGTLVKWWYRARLGFPFVSPITVEVQDDGPPCRFVCTRLRELKRAATMFLKEEGTIAWLRQELRPDDVFLDIGANIGIYTIFAARRLSDGGAVTAVEPHLVNATRLLQNVRANELEDRVSVLTCALAGTNGFRDFNYREWGAGTSNSQLGRCRDSRGRPYEPAARELKAVTTVDTLIAAGAMRRPDLVKIDVDGLEAPILAGMQGLLTGDEPPRLVQVEVEPQTRAIIEERLAGWGYRRQSHHFSKGGKQRLATGEPEDAIPHNVIFEPAG